MNLIQCLLTNNPCYKTGESFVPMGIMIHSTGANNPWVRRYVQPTPNSANYAEVRALLGANNNGNDWNHDNAYWQKYFKKNLNVCVHAFVGKLADGSVASVQTLPWDMRGWHSGSGKKGTANDSYLSFEICEDGLKDSKYFALVYKEAVQLTAYLCNLHNLDPLADGVIICHKEGYQRGIASNHGDVMHWFPKHGKNMDTFRQDVYKELQTYKKKEEKKDVELVEFKKLFNQMRQELRDNDAGAWSKEARDWAVSTGLVQGTGDGKFNGAWEDLLTREQLVTVLYRFAQIMGKV